MTSAIAVHCGAGLHSSRDYQSYNNLSKRACRRGMEALKSGLTALEAVKEAVMVLERHPLTNSGFGSSLTSNGTVETDASIMDGSTLAFGACGSVRKVLNPIDLAYNLCIDQLRPPHPNGLIPPSLLVGQGALIYARTKGLRTGRLVAPKARKTFLKYRFVLENSFSEVNKIARNESDTSGSISENNETLEPDSESNVSVTCTKGTKRCRINEKSPETATGNSSSLLETYCNTSSDIPGIRNEGEPVALDTVGAVCVDSQGHVAAACSSGGIILKHPGRLGQSAVFGAGSWADSSDEGNPVAVCTSGCGEYLVKTHLAKEVAEDLRLNKSRCSVVELHNSMTKKFLDSKFLLNVKQKLAGVLALRVDRDQQEISILWGHSSESMSVGYMSSNTKSVATVSVLPPDVQAGSKIVVGGTHFSIANT